MVCKTKDSRLFRFHVMFKIKSPNICFKRQKGKSSQFRFYHLNLICFPLLLQWPISFPMDAKLSFCEKSLKHRNFHWERKLEIGLKWKENDNIQLYNVVKRSTDLLPRKTPLVFADSSHDIIIIIFFRRNSLFYSTTSFFFFYFRLSWDLTKVLMELTCHQLKRKL